MKKRVMTCLLAALVMMAGFGAFATQVYALDTGFTVSANSFKAEWEKYVKGDKGRAKLVYGYDKTLINEDYARGYHTTKKHCVGVSFKFSKYKAPGVVAKVEKIHRERVAWYSLQY